MIQNVRVVELIRNIGNKIHGMMFDYRRVKVLEIVEAVSISFRRFITVTKTWTDTLPYIRDQETVEKVNLVNRLKNWTKRFYRPTRS